MRFRRLRPEPVLQSVEVVLTEIVVLVHHRNLRIRKVVLDVLAVDRPLGPIAGRPADGPGEVLRIVPARGAGRDEDLWHLLRVEVFLHSRAGRCAEAVENEQHLLLLDQAAGLLDRLRRRVGIVERDEVDLPSVDAALLIDHLEIGGVHDALCAVGRYGSGIGYRLSDRDLGIACPGVVALLRPRVVRRPQPARERRQILSELPASDCHVESPFVPLFAERFGNPAVEQRRSFTIAGIPLPSHKRCAI